jgi:hypothetical protein
MWVNNLEQGGQMELGGKNAATLVSERDSRFVKGENKL